MAELRPDIPRVTGIKTWASCGHPILPWAIADVSAGAALSCPTCWELRISPKPIRWSRWFGWLLLMLASLTLVWLFTLPLSSDPVLPAPVSAPVSTPTTYGYPQGGR